MTRFRLWLRRAFLWASGAMLALSRRVNPAPPAMTRCRRFAPQPASACMTPKNARQGVVSDLATQSLCAGQLAGGTFQTGRRRPFPEGLQ